MPAGRPPYYNNAEDLQKKIDEYFKGGHRTKTIKGIEVPMITITDLVLFLGFCDRASFYDYEKQKEFTYTIKKARTFIEREYEELLRENPTAAIFALKNFGWFDKQQFETTENKTIILKSDKDTDEALDEL